jgi:hypothetical protein
MKPKANFSTTSSVGILLTLALATGAARSYWCIGCEVTTSYQAAVRVYDRARTWGVIAQWWIDPEFGPSVREKQAPKLENVCEMR